MALLSTYLLVVDCKDAMNAAYRVRFDCIGEETPRLLPGFFVKIV